MEEYCKFVNDPLPYSFEAMEPYIDIQTMYLHHDKHLQAYIDKLNTLILECSALSAMTFTDQPQCGFAVLRQILTNLDQIPDYIRTAVKTMQAACITTGFILTGFLYSQKGGRRGRWQKAFTGNSAAFPAFKRN